MPLLQRDIEAAGHLEAFFVSAVASILVIRSVLSLGGYFSLSPGGLHVAHVLWGGLLMMAALLGLLLFLPRGAKRLSAIVGGVGFGMFIDEAGKFVTRDNDYFFRPTFAIIYVIIVLAVLGVRMVRTRWDYSEDEYLSNALSELEESVLHELDPKEQRRALAYLSRADENHPLVPRLREAVLSSMLVPARPPGVAARLRARARTLYRRAAALAWFDDAVAAFFVLRIAVALAVVAVTVILPGMTGPASLPRLLRPLLGRYTTPGTADDAEMVSTFFAAVLAAIGIVRLRTDRLEAFRMFQRSILVSILLTQVFEFYRRQLLAMIGLAFHIALLVAVHYMIEREKERVAAEITLT